jgi:hypothetical protein
MARQTKTELYAECLEIITGLETKLAKVQVFTLAGEDYSRQELLDIFQSLIDAQRATTSAHGRWLDAIGAERKTLERVRVVRNKYRTWTESNFGKGAPAIAVLGFKSTVPAKPNVATREQAIEKRRATRAARGTLGKKLRQAIKGEVPPDEKTKKKG